MQRQAAQSSPGTAVRAVRPADTRSAALPAVQQLQQPAHSMSAAAGQRDTLAGAGRPHQLQAASPASQEQPGTVSLATSDQQAERAQRSPPSARQLLQLASAAEQPDGAAAQQAADAAEHTQPLPGVHEQEQPPTDGQSGMSIALRSLQRKLCSCRVRRGFWYMPAD